MYWRIQEINLLEGYAIRVCFKDGLVGVIRFLPGFFRGVFVHLIDPALFCTAYLIDGAVTWPGDLDLAPDAMYERIKAAGEWVIEE